MGNLARQSKIELTVTTDKFVHPTIGGVPMLSRVLEPELMDTDQDAREYDAMDHAAVNAAFATDFMEAVTDWSPKRPVQSDESSLLTVLDLGAGTGQIPIELCRRMPDIRVVAVDAAASMLAVARQNITAAALTNRISPFLADAKQLPFPDHSFQAVISNSILHHVAEPAQVLAEAVRVAEPEALQFHRDLCRPADEAELARLVGLYAGDATEYQRRLFAESLRAALTLEEIQTLVEQLGFRRDTVAMTSDRHWTWAV
jgi:ubiquinone/menaquinone biosynthesis C-methylase UbiE